jgi:hypothetical protein
MKIAKGRQKSQGRQIHRHSLNAAAISAAARADVGCAGAEWRGRNPFIGAVRDCRFMSGGAEAPGAWAR